MDAAHYLAAWSTQMQVEPRGLRCLPMNGLPDLVIFDCDGVLVDTETIALRAHLRVGIELGWPLRKAEAIDLFSGLSLASIEALVASRCGRQVAANWIERFDRYLWAGMEKELAPIVGLPQALCEIAAMNVLTCVASGGTHEKIRHSLDRTGLHEQFSGHIFSSTDVGRGKPAPDLFLYAAEHMGVHPNYCAVVEDSRPGVLAARAAGMRCFGFAGGLTPEDRLKGNQTIVFHDMTHLPALLGGRPMQVPLP